MHLIKNKQQTTTHKWSSIIWPKVRLCLKPDMEQLCWVTSAAFQPPALMKSCVEKTVWVVAVAAVSFTQEPDLLKLELFISVKAFKSDHYEPDCDTKASNLYSFSWYLWSHSLVFKNIFHLFYSCFFSSWCIFNQIMFLRLEKFACASLYETHT